MSKHRIDLEKTSNVIKKVKNPLYTGEGPHETGSHGLHIKPHVERVQEKGKPATHVGVHGEKSIMHGKARMGMDIGLHGSQGHWSPSVGVGIKIPIKGKHG